MSQPDEKTLERFRAEMKQLAYLFSHGMRNPLVNMQALLSELRDSLRDVGQGRLELLNAEIPDMLSMFEASIKRMYEMVNGADDIYHCMFDAIECEYVELQELVERVANRFDAGVEFAIGDLPCIWADPLALTRVVETVLENGVRAMAGKGGVISVTADSCEGADVLIVRDTGRGMSEEEVERIFDPFCSHSDGGTAMGLAMAKALVEAHGGTIRCESRPGAGSILYVSLPQRSDIR